MENLFVDENKDRLKFFNSQVKINEALPKWKRAKEGLKNKKEKSKGNKEENKHFIPETINLYADSTTSSSVTTIRTFDNYNLYTTPSGVGDNYNIDKVEFDDIAKASIEELNEIIQDTPNIKNILAGYSTGTRDSGQIMPWSPSTENNGKNKKNFLERIRGLWKKEEEKEFTFDAMEFFDNVKFLLKDPTEYKDRVLKYIKSIRQASEMGQIALKETLLKGLLTNKYENILHSNGFLYAVTEEQLINFLKKTEKGINITYISNYARVIPEEVKDKIDEANKLLVFDNYVIMHYSTDKGAVKETETEKAKRRDPILFGVIASAASTDDTRLNKLYYITDWIDETCDLTLDKFMDTLDITKENLEI